MQNSVEPAKKNTTLILALIPVLVFTSIVGLFVFALNSGDPSNLPSALIGKKAPTTAFPPLDGLQRDAKTVPGFNTSSLAKGRVSVVNFWASWCAPCIKEHPQIVALGKVEGVDLYGVNYKDKPVDARRFLKKHGNPFRALGTDPKGRNSIEWGVTAMPETFIVNKAGEIIFKHTGPITPAILTQKLLPLIQAANTAK